MQQLRDHSTQPTIASRSRRPAVCAIPRHGCAQRPPERRRSGSAGRKLHVQCADSAGKLAAHREYHAERGASAVHPDNAHADNAQAQVYEAEGNDSQVYLLLYRHADLVLQKLQAHPDRSRPDHRKALNAATAMVSSDLKKMEDIAPRIKRRHEEYQERRGRQLEALQSLEGKGIRALPQELDGLSVQDRKRTSYDQRPTLDARAHENHSLAARLAQRELHRRDTARRGIRQHGVSEEDEHERRTGGTWDSWQDELAHENSGRGGLSSQLQEVARLQQNGHRTSYSSVSGVKYSFC